MTDFIIVAFNNFNYIKFLVNSIHTHCKNYTITIVNNGDSDMYMQLSKLDGHNIRVIQQRQIADRENYVCKYDGRLVNKASWYHAIGLTLGIESSNHENIVVLDHDVVFVNPFLSDISDLLNDNVFVSSIFDDGVGIARPYFMAFKRSLLIQYAREQNDLLPNINYKDTLGTMTLYCNENKLPYHVLETDHNEKRYQQTYINNKLFMYHYHRGAIKNHSDWETFCGAL